MPGRRQWETVVASAPRQSIMSTQQTFSPITIGVGQTMTFDLYAPSGTVGRVQSMYINQPTTPLSKGASIDGHSAVITTTLTGGSIIIGNFSKAQGILFNRFQFGPNTAIEPNSIEAIVVALKDVTFDSVNGLQLRIANNTDAILANITLQWFVNWVKSDAA